MQSLGGQIRCIMEDVQVAYMYWKLISFLRPANETWRRRSDKMVLDRPFSEQFLCVLINWKHGPGTTGPWGCSSTKGRLRLEVQFLSWTKSCYLSTRYWNLVLWTQRRAQRPFPWLGKAPCWGWGCCTLSLPFFSLTAETIHGLLLAFSWSRYLINHTNFHFQASHQRGNFLLNIKWQVSGEETANNEAYSYYTREKGIVTS